MHVKQRHDGVIEYPSKKPRLLLNNQQMIATSRTMKQRLYIITLLAAVAFSAPSFAQCFVDYKAKRDAGGLELHYGVMQLNTCENAQDIDAEVQARIAQDGWQLLRVMSSFKQNKLQDKQANAGEYFLRY